MTICQMAFMIQVLAMLNGPLIEPGRFECFSMSCIEADGSIYAGPDVFCMTRDDQLRWQGRLDLLRDVRRVRIPRREP